MNRDPIEEKGGLNVYVFTGNTSVNSFDALGHQAGPIGPTDPRFNPGQPGTGIVSTTAYTELRYKPELEQLSCCSDDRIQNGKQILQQLFNTASASLSNVCNPANPGDHGATCKNSSQDLISWLLPTPPCWTCYLEQRNLFPDWFDSNNQYSDHQVIICRSYKSSGSISGEVIFDWWGDNRDPNTPPSSGGFPDAYRNKFRYPDPDQHITEYPFWQDCCGNYPRGRGPKPGFDASTQ